MNGFKVPNNFGKISILWCNEKNTIISEGAKARFLFSFFNFQKKYT